MRALVLALAAAAAACSPEPGRPFSVGVLEPASARVAAAARRLGLEVSAQAPPGAATVSAALPLKGEDGEMAADAARLRFLAARAVAKGSEGIFLRLPRTPADRDLLEYVEEWQAVERVARELVALRPIIRGGTPASAPFPVPVGLEFRAWTFHGRGYVVLVNPTGVPLPLGGTSLATWRALFSVRSDPRQVLPSCGTESCLPPEGALWLEGRLWPEILP